MTRLRDIKTTFTAGEVSPDLLGRGDLTAYENGALALRNVFIQPTGGITRRAGLSYIDSAQGAGRLVPFEFNTQQTYLLVLTDAQITVYAGGVSVQTLASPWSGALTTRLPPANAAEAIGRTITIKKTDSSSNPIYISEQGGAGPDQQTQTLTSQYQAITVLSNGGQWYVLSQYP